MPAEQMVHTGLGESVMVCGQNISARKEGQLKSSKHCLPAGLRFVRHGVLASVEEAYGQPSMNTGL